ncbi:glutamate dehydrogenase (NAD(+)) [Saccharomycopsis crataegensis]|uniref:NAD-specific glutamate dehydrogenase n=1 Tax=Saccharomycopsis crataegensis TaxID=43959 RepID=A0AAV5QET8_9ASCO|nr:glutamate dehydrogenase (NAD(+)) [Saccharomycopsis crataegensis]
MYEYHKYLYNISSIFLPIPIPIPISPAPNNIISFSCCCYYCCCACCAGQTTGNHRKFATPSPVIDPRYIIQSSENSLGHRLSSLLKITQPPLFSFLPSLLLLLLPLLIAAVFSVLLEQTPFPQPPTMSLNIESNIAAMSLQSNASGYVPVPFPGKDKQFDHVLDELDKAGFIPEPLIESEARWFYESLGIDDVYFSRESVDGIVSHIHALYAAKLEQYASGNVDVPFIHLRREADDHAVYFDSSIPNSPEHLSTQYEKRIDERYLNSSSASTVSYRLESFKAPLHLSSKSPTSAAQDICLYFVYRNSFPHLDKVSNDTTDLNLIGDSTFLRIASDNTKYLYQKIIKEAVAITGPVIHHYRVDSSTEHRLIIAFRQGTSTNYSSALTSLLQYYNLSETRKYVEQFANGMTVISCYIVPNDNIVASELSVHQVIKEASLLYCLPNNEFYGLFATGALSLQESIYAHCGAIFVSHFLNRLGPEYAKLSTLLDPSKSVQHQEVLNSLKHRLRAETYTPSFIQEVFVKYRDIVSRLYRHFADVHYISSKMEKTLSYQRLATIPTVGSDAHFESILAKEVSQNEHAALVLRALYVFNKSILKTNFYTPTKVAISFRLNPTFLPKEEYPAAPFGMFFVVGSEFRGFHIRFRDIARGGIRVVQSRSDDAYAVNARNLIDENYGLASTQQRKNKDIPEGGSKGVILLDPGVAQTRPRASFEKYIDSIIDLLIVSNIPGVKEPVVDLYKTPEIIFMGPDEGTSGFVDWATLHARARGAPWWKSFFTGKSPSLGGIPHDAYGMTTLSVRAYVEEIYNKKNIDANTTAEKVITKFQTGGPSGDLGSNEILLSKPAERYVAIVDGPACVGDPNGLDKSELVRLAKARLDISHYDTTKLSKDGYLIKVDDQDVKLPNGLTFANGVVFRNTFHLRLKDLFGHIDLFVPCGGRPASIDTNNVHTLIDEKTGQSIIPYIVEGANLFITQSAKIELENAGAILFKDASTNKGGVTSSSKEVMASLVLDDETFLSKMCIAQGAAEPPKFYQDYVKEVQRIIQRNARLEFHALWKLREETGKPFSELSDELSFAINELADALAESDSLWAEDLSFRDAVLNDALPALLLNEVPGGVEGVVKRVPEAYMRRVFSTQVAGEYVYTKGPGGNPAKFLEFISGLRKKFVKEGLV